MGEFDRTLLDDLVRDGVPHHVVRVVEGAPVVGPFVLPGETACLRCVDDRGALPGHWDEVATTLEVLDSRRRDDAVVAAAAGRPEVIHG